MRIAFSRECLIKNKNLSYVITRVQSMFPPKGSLFKKIKYFIKEYCFKISMNHTIGIRFLRNNLKQVSRN